MAKDILEERSLEHLLKAVTHLLQLPQRRMWLDYDAEADVLYVHFTDAADTTHSDLRDDGIILDYQHQDIVGVTILDASRR